jgi:hypothetical protein
MSPGLHCLALAWSRTPIRTSPLIHGPKHGPPDREARFGPFSVSAAISFIPISNYYHATCRFPLLPGMAPNLKRELTSSSQRLISLLVVVDVSWDDRVTSWLIKE